MADRSQGETALVQFNERLTNSAAFGNLFREGMDLVEETPLSRRRWPHRRQGAGALRQSDLRDRKHAADHPPDAARLVAAAATARSRKAR